MKKLLSYFPLVLIPLTLACVPASAWGPVGHRLSSYIAQRYLTPAAEEAVTSILDCSMECASNYPDTYRLDAWEGNREKAPDYCWNAHTVRFGPDFRPLTWGYDPQNLDYEDIKELIRKLGPTSCGHMAVMYHEKSLRAWKEHNDSTNVADLKMLIHLFTDLHCPGHQQYCLPDGSNDPDRSSAWGKCNFGLYKDKPMALHKILDAAPERCHPEFCEEGANLRAYADAIDTWPKEKIRASVQGSIFDWFSDNARRCYWLQGPDGPVVRSTVVDEKFYREVLEPIVSYQIVVAGYRLAELLNNIFDPDYKGL